MRLAFRRLARCLEDVRTAHRGKFGRTANHWRRVRSERGTGQRGRVGRIAVRVKLVVLRVKQVRVELVLLDETARGMKSTHTRPEYV